MHANRKESWIGKPNAIVHLSRFFRTAARDDIDSTRLFCDSWHGYGQTQENTMHISDMNPHFKLNDEQRKLLREAFYAIPVKATRERDAAAKQIKSDLKALAAAPSITQSESLTQKVRLLDELNSVVHSTAHWIPANYDRTPEETILTEMLNKAASVAFLAMTLELHESLRRLFKYISDAIDQAGLPGVNPFYKETRAEWLTDPASADLH